MSRNKGAMQIRGAICAVALLSAHHAAAQQPQSPPKSRQPAPAPAPPKKPETRPPDPAVPADAQPIARPPDGWRSIATDQDKKRIRQWWSAWNEALKSARAGGNAAAISREDVLLKPDAALPNPFLPPGDYRCRVIKLGAPGGNGRAYTAYPFFKCRVAAEQAIFSFTKLTGSQRPIGLLFDDSEKRQIFLGTMVLGDETAPLDYATDSKRDMAGLMERIGPQRWRLVLPYPAFESLLDVFEIVPEKPPRP